MIQTSFIRADLDILEICIKRFFKFSLKDLCAFLKDLNHDCHLYTGTVKKDANSFCDTILHSFIHMLLSSYKLEILSRFIVSEKWEKMTPNDTFSIFHLVYELCSRSSGLHKS